MRSNQNTNPRIVELKIVGGIFEWIKRGMEETLGAVKQNPSMRKTRQGQSPNWWRSTMANPMRCGAMPHVGWSHDGQTLRDRDSAGRTLIWV